MKRLLYLIFLALALLQGGFAQSQNPVALPPMGWLDWPWRWQNVDHSGTWQPTETFIKQQCDALRTTGLLALGYNYCVPTDPWDDRDGSGNLEGVPSQFPSGMASLGSYIHGECAGGVCEKFGLYGGIGTTTCAGAPAQYGHEAADMTAACIWGVDYWYDDLCGGDSTCPSGVQNCYSNISQKIQATSCPNMIHHVNAYGNYGSVTWFKSAGASTVRIGTDNNNTTVEAKYFATDWTQYSPYQSKGYWLDGDHLLCDLRDNGATGPGLGTAVTDAQCRAQFNIIAILAQPIWIGANLTTLSANTLTTISNSEVIAINQDSQGTMGKRVSQVACGGAGCEVWVRSLSNNRWAVMLMNRDTGAAHNISATWSMFNQRGVPFLIRDAWAHSDLGKSTAGITATNVSAYGSMVYVLTPAQLQVGSLGVSNATVQ